MGTAELGTLYLVFVLIALVAGVLWILLPFAVFGIKPRLDMPLHEQRETNTLLKTIAERARHPTPLPPVPKSPLAVPPDKQLGTRRHDNQHPSSPRAVASVVRNVWYCDSRRHDALLVASRRQRDTPTPARLRQQQSVTPDPKEKIVNGTVWRCQRPDGVIQYSNVKCDGGVPLFTYKAKQAER